MGVDAASCRSSSRSRSWPPTPTSPGLRAPALIAFVKDALIYIVVIAAVIVIPYKLGGFGRDLRRGRRQVRRRAPTPATASSWPSPPSCSTPRWRFGSALALFLYPHCITGVLAANAARHHQAQHGRAAGLQLRARAARPARLHGHRRGGQADRPAPTASPTPTRSCRCSSSSSSRPGSPASPSPRSGSAPWCRPRSCRSRRPTCSPATSTRSTCNQDATPKQEARSRKLASLVVKLGALLAILALDPQFTHRAAAHRRRDHPADPARGGAGPVHAAGSTPRP